jgi:SAM-dependent methyltransferase
MEPEGKTSRDFYTDGHYRKLNPTWGLEDSAWKATQVLSLIEKHRISARTVCEVGCGGGGILCYLHQNMPKDVNFTGYEISPQAIELCKQKAGERLKYILGDILTEANAFYDLLLVLDVVEHVEDYFDFLRKLKKRGEFKIFTIPLELSALSILRRLPIERRRAFGHIHHFSKETAIQSLCDCGYEIVDYRYIETAFVSEPSSLKTFINKCALRTACKINLDWGVRIMGGHALLILAK